jgi:hypothetical protein
MLARSSPSFCDRLRLLDSTPVPCAQSRETVKRTDLAGHGAYGYCASHSRYFWGFRLYLVCSPDGMPHGFCLAPANEGEREVAAALLDSMRRNGALRGDEIVIGDKWFAGEEFEQIVQELAAQLLRPDRKNEQPRNGNLGRRPPMDRIDLQHHQRPTLARTPRRPHPRRRLGTCLPTSPRARRRRLEQLAARTARPRLHRL